MYIYIYLGVSYLEKGEIKGLQLCNPMRKMLAKQAVRFYTPAEPGNAASGIFLAIYDDDIRCRANSLCIACLSEIFLPISNARPTVPISDADMPIFDADIRCRYPKQQSPSTCSRSVHQEVASTTSKKSSIKDNTPLAARCVLAKSSPENTNSRCRISATLVSNGKQVQQR